VVCLVTWAIAACSPTPQPVGHTTGDNTTAEVDTTGEPSAGYDGTVGEMVGSNDETSSLPDQLAFEAGATGDRVGPDRLRFALVRPDSTLPARLDLADRSAVLVTDLLYDGLTTFDVGRGAVEPGLARRWASDDDFDRWEFELDPEGGVGVDDVATSFGELTESEDPLVARTAGNIKAVTGTGHRVVIELDRSDPDFPATIAGVAFSIVGVAADGSAGLPTGRFTVISDDTNGMILRSDQEGRNRPAAGTSDVLITWVDDVDQGYDQLTLGLVDAAAVDQRHVADARSRFAETFPMVNTSRFLVVNPRSSALATVAARSALAATLDLSDLVANGAQAGTWIRRDSIRPGPYGGGGESVVDIDSCGDDPCGSAGMSDSTHSSVRRTVTVGFSDEAGEDLARRVATDLRSAGWVVDLALVPTGLSAGVADSGIDVVVVDQTWPWPTGGHALAALTGPGRFLADVDIGRESAAEIMAAALSVDNAVERAAAVASLEEMLVESGWLIPVAGRRSMLARSPVVQRLGLTFDGSLNLAD
jgi:hypothetical protein